MKKFTREKFRFTAKISFLSLFIVAFAVGHLIAVGTPSELKNHQATLEESMPVYQLPTIDEIILDANYNISDIYFSMPIESTIGSLSLKCNFDYEAYTDALYVSYDFNYGSVSYSSDISYDIYGGHYGDVPKFHENNYYNRFFRIKYVVSCSLESANTYRWTILPIFCVKEGTSWLLESEYTLPDLQASFTGSSGYTDQPFSNLYSDAFDGRYIVWLNTFNDVFSIEQASYQNGISAVVSNPGSYGLYTYAQYLAYGEEQYQLGYNSGAQVLSVSGMLREIFASPITMFKTIFTDNAAFRWELPTGEVLDISGLLTFFLTIGIAFTIVSLISKIGGH